MTFQIAERNEWPSIMRSYPKLIQTIAISCVCSEFSSTSVIDHIRIPLCFWIIFPIMQYGLRENPHTWICTANTGDIDFPLSISRIIERIQCSLPPCHIHSRAIISGMATFQEFLFALRCAKFLNAFLRFFKGERCHRSGNHNKYRENENVSPTYLHFPDETVVRFETKRTGNFLPRKYGSNSKELSGVAREIHLTWYWLGQRLLQARTITNSGISFHRNPYGFTIVDVCIQKSVLSCTFACMDSLTRCLGRNSTFHDPASTG